MFDLAHALREPYPQREDQRRAAWLEERGEQMFAAAGRWRRARVGAVRRIVALVAGESPRLERLDAAGIETEARAVGLALRRGGFAEDLVARSFALVRLAAERTLGLRHFDVQLMGGYALLQGMVAEMDTGEGKTLTATLAASTAALAGVPTHVVTVNDYLVTRDAGDLRPLYAALGLTVGAVIGGMPRPERQAAYRCDVTYCTNKDLTFDYLRDRLELGASAGAMRLRLERLHGDGARVRRLHLRGLGFAIVDEADSVLVDEARTPLIITAQQDAGEEARIAREALDLAGQLMDKQDYRVDLETRRTELTERGRTRVEELAAGLGSFWRTRLGREELATQALAARLLYRRDEHYLVREGKIQIVDEFTGRVLADRSWGQGIHQMVEAKEGCEVTARREPLASISYQRFFRRYLLLAGMTGTAREVAGELAAVYGLAVVRIPTNRPCRRVIHPDQVFATEQEKWRAVARRVRDLHRAGRAVLVGTRSVLASETLSAALTACAVPHSVLNAKQDQEEAQIVAQAGAPGRITIATNMAGRGTDIKLQAGATDAGGLHVILTERHEAGRIDRQLAGRCARQGDPGSFEAMVALEDPLLDAYRALSTNWLPKLPLQRGIGRLIALALIRAAQTRAERLHSRVRKDLLKNDQRLADALAYSGRAE